MSIALTVHTLGRYPNSVAGAHMARCLFHKFGTSRTSCPRRRASSPQSAHLLDSRFRGNDTRPQELAVDL
jgi:hypothetical protein